MEAPVVGGVIQNRKLALGLYTGLSLVAIPVFFWVILLRSASLVNRGVVFLGAFPAFLLAVAFFSLVGCWKNDKGFMFLLVAVPASVAFSLFILPGHVPDEGPHIWQVAAAFTRSASGFPVPNAYLEANLPASYEDAYKALLAAPAWGSTFMCSRYLGSLSIVYLVPSAAISLFRLLNLNEYAALFAARMLNAIFYVSVAYILIKAIPIGKTLLLVYCLNPILIQQQASCSADAATNIAALAYIVALVRACATITVSRRDWVVLGALCFLNCIFKSFAYAPLTLLMLLLLKRNSARWKVQWLAMGIAIALGSIALIAVYRGSFMAEGFELLRTPLFFVQVVIKSIWEMMPFWGESFGGHDLGALSINTWYPCFWAYLILLALAVACCDDAGEVHFDLPDKVLVFLVVFANFLVVLLSMRGWTLQVDKRSDIIMGVQGRYFFPLILPMLLVLTKEDKREFANSLSLYSAVCMAVIFLIDLYCIYISF